MNLEEKICQSCTEDNNLDFDFTMAFQPIINCSNETIYGYEALVRGINNESAYSVISRVNDSNRYLFDQLCRVKAISLASKLNITSMLSINFLPNAVYVPERCIRTTFEAAKQYDFPTERIMFEFTEVEKIDDTEHVKRIVDYYQSLGFKTAVDDFGSGYSGLNLLADFQTDIIKLDMALIRHIDSNKVRQAIIKNCITMFDELNITTLAEGIETYEEYAWLRDAGIKLMQGYYFAKPGFESLPEIDHGHYRQASQ
ncbi:MULTISPECIES: EAL domain-containing protein [unclassified Methylophaga]|jgi:EAL domain-containing protein (putative c-di-GMP-specific phosphodiesterase class I)|uniref:EAL domain-containing protein n=1 Tax=unclassified Methylophaga TaxID=2629249 RepID=UPI00259CFE5E|nr:MULTISPECIES: EAL domain-containing protein [unclassified Methylophaga]|tara:strand:- start:290 stop:1057 length:768 start_codon:yes stop_codon:yes gene_type:complete